MNGPDRTKADKRAHALPAACPGPWHVVGTVSEMLVVSRCEHCGSEVLVFKPSEPA